MSRQPQSDPFRLLAIVSIVLGMVIVLAAVILYYLTPAHIASPYIFGAGLTLSIGGGLPNMLSRIANPMPAYQPPDAITEVETPIAPEAPRSGGGP